MYRISFFIGICITIAWGDINFDALEKKKSQTSASVSLDFSDATKAGDKEWQQKQEANRKERERLARQRPKNYTPNYEYCNSGDTCYQIVRFEKSGAAIIQCIKGTSTGQEKCLSYNGKKYAAGCSLTDAFAHHYTLKEAGNFACEH